MTQSQFKTICDNNLSTLPTAELKNVIKELFLKLDDKIDIIFNSALDILITRLSENEFSNFVNSL